MKEIARAMEDSDKQARSMEGLKSVVNKLTFRDKTKSNEMKEEVCFAFGYQGHKAGDPKCPAKGKKCRKCGGILRATVRHNWIDLSARQHTLNGEVTCVMWKIPHPKLQLPVSTHLVYMIETVRKKEK